MNETPLNIRIGTCFQRKIANRFDKRRKNKEKLIPWISYEIPIFTLAFHAINTYTSLSNPIRFELSAQHTNVLPQRKRYDSSASNTEFRINMNRKLLKRDGTAVHPYVCFFTYALTSGMRRSLICVRKKTYSPVDGIRLGIDLSNIDYSKLNCPQ